MVRADKLREFRDAGKLNYRVEEVDKLAAEQANSGGNVLGHDSDGLSADDLAEIALSPMDSDPGLGKLTGSGSGSALSGSGSSSSISLADSSEGAAMGKTDIPIDLGGSGTSLSGLSGSTEIRLEDSGSGTAPLRLDDSKSGTKAGGKAGGGKSGGSTSSDALSLDEVDKDAVQGMKKDDTVITNIGISVFDDDDLEIAADPMAKTMMTGGEEHLGLDGSGGVSGLLDLTRESDDTSLGAELLEGIDMGDTAETLAQYVQQDSSQNEPPMPVEGAPLDAPAAQVYVPVSMVPVEPLSPMFTGLLIAAVIVLGLAGATGIAISLDTWPSYLAMLGDLFPWSLIGTIVVGVVFALIGFLVGRSAQRGPRPPKPAKAKEPKEKKAKGKKGDAAVAAAKG